MSMPESTFATCAARATSTARASSLTAESSTGSSSPGTASSSEARRHGADVIKLVDFAADAQGKARMYDAHDKPFRQSLCLRVRPGACPRKVLHSGRFWLCSQILGMAVNASKEQTL
jgi:hypothetical protein